MTLRELDATFDTRAATQGWKKESKTWFKQKLEFMIGAKAADPALVPDMKLLMLAVGRDIRVQA